MTYTSTCNYIAQITHIGFALNLMIICACLLYGHMVSSKYVPTPQIGSCNDTNIAVSGDITGHVYFDHRPHSRQITGARCTEVAARQSWAEYSSRPATDNRHQGWAIKYFFVLSEMLTICEQPLYGIVLMILHTNKSCVLIRDQNSQIFLKSI